MTDTHIDYASHPLVLAALEFATWAHGSIDHRRKYTNTPYIGHPVEVMNTVRRVAHTPEMLAAALLHDTAEDVPAVTLDLILERFGSVVARYVEGLTDVPLEGLKRAERQTRYRERLMLVEPEVQTIKVADLLSNTQSIVKYDTKFAKVYIPEKALLLPVLTKAHPLLLGELFVSLVKACQELRISLQLEAGR